MAAVTGVHSEWSGPTALDGPVHAEPLVCGKSVFVATEENTVYSINASSGGVLWHTHLGSPVAGRPALWRHQPERDHGNAGDRPGHPHPLRGRLPQPGRACALRTQHRQRNRAVPGPGRLPRGPLRPPSRNGEPSSLRTAWSTFPTAASSVTVPTTMATSSEFRLVARAGWSPIRCRLTEKGASGARPASPSRRTGTSTSQPETAIRRRPSTTATASSSSRRRSRNWGTSRPRTGPN